MTEHLENELREVIEKIGEARVTGTGNLEDLRQRKAEIETELSEMGAETEYRKAKAAADAEAQRQADIAAKVEDFENQAEDFKKQFNFVESALKNLDGATKELAEAVDCFLDTPNPLPILKSVWKNLDRGQQMELETKINDNFDLQRKIPGNLEAVKVLDQLNKFVDILDLQRRQLRTAPIPKSQKVRTAMSTRKKPGPTYTPLPPQQHHHKAPADQGMRPVPKFNKNRPAGEQLIG